jgi:Zn-dependent peptidase ImmA (M78 family)/DNA-binding XRE family transcriptional regulator
MAIEAFVTPRLVRWARERYRLSPDDVAKKIGVRDANTVEAWERGEARPTLRQAQELAQKLSVPFGYLYLSEPPAENLPLPDLRTVAGAPPSKPSPNFLDVLYDALRKQSWYRDHLASQNEEPLAFIARYDATDDPNVIAADIRKILGIDAAFRQKASNWERFLTDLIRQAEEVGILVLRNSVVGNNTHRPFDVEEFRGFAISDTFARLVFINSRDAKAAQIFTLAHELPHLWIGESGVSNPDYKEPSAQQRHSIERVCNAVAAEVLVPSEEFLLRWDDDLKTLDENLHDLVVVYRVSAFVILRRAHELGRISTETYRETYRENLSSRGLRPRMMVVAIFIRHS